MFASLLFLVVLRQVDCLGAVPRAAGDGVEFKVLFKADALARSVVEALLFMMDAEEVKAGHEQHRHGERDPGNIDLRSVPSASR